MLMVVEYGEKIIILKAKELLLDLAYLYMIGSSNYCRELARTCMIPDYSYANVRYRRKRSENLTGCCNLCWHIVQSTIHITADTLYGEMRSLIEIKITKKVKLSISQGLIHCT